MSTQTDFGRQSSGAFEAANDEPDAAQRERLLGEAQALAGDSALAGAYTWLQQAVGIIAVLLPIVLLVYSAVDGHLQGSISDYYYTRVGNYFVGTLCALAVFFLSYNSKPLPGHRRDQVMSNIASAAAIGVAMFPTANDVATASGGAKTIAFVHLVCAAVLFATLAAFCLTMFTRTGGPMTPQKRTRNTIYRACGIVILAAMVAVGLSNLLDVPESWHSLFWLETVMVWAFGFSWLVKGGFLRMFADQ